MWDSEGVRCCNPHDSEAGVGVGREVASILATFLTDVQHRSKMVTKSCLPLCGLDFIINGKSIILLEEG